MLRPSLKFLGFWSAVFTMGYCLLPVPSFSSEGERKTTVIPLVAAANWRLVKSQVLNVDLVGKYGGDPLLEREYGVQSLVDRTYQLGSIPAEVIVEPLPDLSAAYGLLTCYRTEAMQPEKGMQLALYSRGGALMARDRAFIRVPRPRGSELTDNEFRALLIFVGETQPSSAGLENLPAALPNAGLIPGSEKYLLGPEGARRALPSFRRDLFGFSEGAEVEMGDYAAVKARITLLAITYPTPQIARLQYGLIEKSLGLNRDHGPGSVYGKRAGSFVFLVMNSDSAATATKYMDQFKVSKSVSWDKPYPGDKPIVLQVVELILANMAFVLILVVLGLVGGVLIVLSRIFVARFFPHLAWGRPEDGTIIRLGLM